MRRVVLAGGEGDALLLEDGAGTVRPVDGEHFKREQRNALLFGQGLGLLPKAVGQSLGMRGKVLELVTAFPPPKHALSAFPWVTGEARPECAARNCEQIVPDASAVAHG